MSTVTRLGYAMEILGITGKELALEIDTDITTVSKWKNGQRKLKLRSHHLDKIARYFLSEHFSYQKKQLLQNIDIYDMKFEDLKEEEVLEALKAWLIADVAYVPVSMLATIPEAQEVNVGVHTGYEGWKRAMDIFWGTLKTLPPGQGVYIGDFGDIHWDDVDPEALKSMIENILKVVNMGHKVVIIDYMTDAYKPYVVILRWLNVYLSENVEIRYIYKNNQEIYNESIYLIEGHLTQIGMSMEADHSDHITLVHRDEASLRFYSKAVAAIMEKSHRLVHVSDLRNPSNMLEVMESSFKDNHTTYMINQMPTFRNMPTKLLKEVLEDNDVPEDIQAICIEANLRRKELRKKFKYVQIYNLDALEEAVESEYSVDYDLSIIVGKEIRLKKKYIQAHLAYLTTIRNNDDYTMVLTSFKNLNLNVDKSCISVQDDSIVIAWNPERFDRAIYCTELTVVGGYFQYLREIWEQIPPISKSDHWRNKQLHRLLNR